MNVEVLEKSETVEPYSTPFGNPKLIILLPRQG